MAHVVTQSCVGDGSCVYACPVNCIQPTPDDPAFELAEMLYIDPVSCVDCGACVSACPVDAIKPQTRLAGGEQAFVKINAAYHQVPRRRPSLAPVRPPLVVRDRGESLRVAARVAQRVLGPALAGRMATFLAPATVAQLAPRIEAEFLAGIAQSVDASRLTPLLASLATDTVVAASSALRRREDWVTLGAFAEQLPEASLRSAVAGFDDQALIATAKMVTAGERERLLAALPSDRAATLRLKD